MSARHHLVPQFYLRAFADDRDRVRLVARTDYSRTLVTSVRKAVAEVGFYRIETEELEIAESRVDHDPEVVEQHLSTLEAHIAPVVRRVVSQRSLECDSEEAARQVWYRLIQFTALQSVRGHRWREDLTALITQAMKVEFLSRSDDASVGKWLRETGKPHDAGAVSSFQQALAEGPFPRIVVPQAAFVQESLKMALGNPVTGDPGIGQYLASKRMSLVRPDSVRVLTSDEPVCWWAPDDRAAGYATARVVWFPLSPDLILQYRDPDADMAAAGLPDPTRRKGHDRLAFLVNDIVAEQAQRWIVHHPEDRPLAGMVAPAVQVWGDELVGVNESDGVRREIYVHRRLRGSD